MIPLPPLGLPATEGPAAMELEAAEAASAHSVSRQCPVSAARLIARPPWERAVQAS